MSSSKSANRGFTLVELVIVIAIGLILVATALPTYKNLQASAKLSESSMQIIQTLRLAREQSASGYNGAGHGVYFIIAPAGADSFVAYQGASYATRQIIYDRAFAIDENIGLTAADFTLTGNDVDINFSKGAGVSNNTGTFTLTFTGADSRQISVNSFGKIEEN